MKYTYIGILVFLILVSSCATKNGLTEKPAIVETPAFVPPAEEPGQEADEIAAIPAQPAAPVEAPPEEEIIILKDRSAEPFNLIIAKGASVTFKNEGLNVHRIRINEDLYLSDRIPPGESFTYTFERPDTYVYRSIWSGAVNGEITVVEKKDLITGRVPSRINFDREGFFDIINVLIMSVLIGIIASYLTSRKDY